MAHRRIKYIIQSRIRSQFWLLLVIASLGLLNQGCFSQARSTTTNTRWKPSPQETFSFSTDTPAFHNQLVWSYEVQPDGSIKTRSRQPPPPFSHRCFAMSAMVWRFHHAAVFAPSRQKVTGDRYRRIIRKVLNANPRTPLSELEVTIIPGYSNLREFSRDWEPVIKENIGGAWKSYVQRGNWRMIFPFSRLHQRNTARSVKRSLEEGELAILHIVRFPDLAINHTVVAFDFIQTSFGITFLAYDPNNSSEPMELVYDPLTDVFLLPPSKYFKGGAVDAYRIYNSWWN